MAIKSYKPTTPARRGMTSQDLSSVTERKGPKALRSVKKSQAGRNNAGKITVRHRGSGVKKFYRNVNFDLPTGTSAIVEAIEYDPNRSARIARVKDDKGQLHYVLANSKLKIGQTITSGDEAGIEQGNRLALKAIPTGSVIHNIEMQPGKGGQMVRSAGASAQLMAKEGKYAQLRLPSGEVRLVSLDCRASLGAVGNEQHQNMKLGSAGRRRKMGWRPSVRGKVMNAADHPHGGGDGGRHHIGGGATHGRSPRTPWGQKTLGYKTRRRKTSSKFIVRSRHEAKR